MSPRIAYWTSAFEPEMEAIASEVATLRRRFSGSVAWGLHPRRWAQLSWNRGYGFNPRLHLLFRAATRVFEPAFQLNHVFGSVGDWYYLEGRRQRPIVLTMATRAEPVDPPLLDRVSRFVAESEECVKELRELGVDAGRIRLILPPVNLRRFIPTPPPAGPFTVLFASSPDNPQWLAARGVPLLLDVAALRPGMRFRLLWRPWGKGLERVHYLVGARELRNVEVAAGYWRNMPRQYQRAHVTVAPFTDALRAKPAPNSLIESIACGRPVVATNVVGLSHLLGREQAGVVCEPTAESVADALDRVQADWVRLSRAARDTAEKWFAEDGFLKAYEALYHDVLRLQ